MSSPIRFDFVRKSNTLGEISYVSYLPLSLAAGDSLVSVSGLLDTGASVNVLPYEIGLQLSLEWEKQNIAVILAGNLAKFPAQGVILLATVAQFPSAPLAFAWTQARNIPLILGGINFFQEFNVCFFGSQLVFEIEPKSTNNYYINDRQI
jgi:hypothetical protein